MNRAFLLPLPGTLRPVRRYQNPLASQQVQSAMRMRFRIKIHGF